MVVARTNVALTDSTKPGRNKILFYPVFAQKATSEIYAGSTVNTGIEKITKLNMFLIH